MTMRALAPDAPVAARAYDGSRAGPTDAAATLVVRTPDALARIVTRPGELGFARAYVAGELDVEGDIYELVRHAERFARVPRDPEWWWTLAKAAAPRLRHRHPAPPEEARSSGRLHSKRRDAAVISHHYDVSNDFYRLVLGPSMTYSCAVFGSADDTLEQAQHNKYALIAGKLGLEPGQRLLDVGCGWGSMAIHAAEHRGARAVGITISRAQAELAAKRAAEAGFGDQIDIRFQDYRDVDDGPYDAVSSIGMFEHVGRAGFEAYARRLHAQLRPGGRLLNHAISRPGRPEPDTRRGHLRAASRRVSYALGSSRDVKAGGSFIPRYVFPDGELHEVGSVVSTLADAGFEIRHVESLREHYALTLRHWVANLEANWDEATRHVSDGRARVWRLYMAGSAVGFERGHISVHQVLAVKPDGNSSHMPLRPDW